MQKGEFPKGFDPRDWSDEKWDDWAVVHAPKSFWASTVRLRRSWVELKKVFWFAVTDRYKKVKRDTRL